MRTIPTAQATTDTHFRGTHSAQWGGARVFFVRPMAPERQRIGTTSSNLPLLGFTVKASIGTSTASPAASVSPSDVEYQQLVAEWADAYDRQTSALSEEEIAELYDDAYFEALDLQQELP